MARSTKWRVAGKFHDQHLQVEYLDGTTLTDLGIHRDDVTIAGKPVHIGDVGENWRVVPLKREKEPKQRPGSPVHPAQASKQRLRGIAQGKGERRKAKKAADTIAWKQPDADEKAIQDMNRMMRRFIQEAPEGQGAVVGPLRVAATFIAAQLQEAHGLQGEEHRVAIIEYLVGQWGDAIHAFPAPVRDIGYFEHLEQSKA